MEFNERLGVAKPVARDKLWAIKEKLDHDDDGPLYAFRSHFLTLEQAIMRDAKWGQSRVHECFFARFNSYSFTCQLSWF